MRYRDRLATLGMAVVLVVLLAVGLGDVIATQRATSRVTHAVALNGNLQTAQHLFSDEVGLLDDYYLVPSTRTRAQFNAAADAQVAGLRAAKSEAEPADESGMAQAGAAQTAFRTAADSFFAAVDAGKWDRAVAIKSQTITPQVQTIRQVIDVGSGLLTQRLATTIGALNTTEDAIRIISIATFVPGVLLLLVLARLLHTYRRQLVATARAEITHLQQYAVTDHLTGLGNHRAFADEETRALGVAHRATESLAIALIDIDDFKQINDQHGHSHGDRVLAVLGELLRSGRAGDRAFRLGGDEFALIMPAAGWPAAMTTLERLRRAVEQQLFGATISIGVAILEPGTDDMATLREKADGALYEAKRRGRDRIVTFAEIQDSASIVSTAKLLAVRRLLSEQRLSIVFQPIWRLDQGVILGYEALMRPDDEYELDGPQEAFDIAERIGRAPELDALCREAILARAGELPEDVLLFINISPQSLDHPLLAGETLAAAVTAAGMTPTQIVLEITERSLARPAVVSRETKRLRALGFRIALDDVGMGSTGLEMLRLVPVEYLKIDRTVVAGALADTTTRSVLAAILAFAQQAGTFVIAEGIETEEMLDFVDEAGRANPFRHAHAVQGYLTGRPSPTIAGSPAHVQFQLPSGRAAS